MRYGVIVTGGEPRQQIELVREAEAAGWDGVFTWDGIHLGDELQTYDPWALMGAFAAATERVTLGAIISPLSRRRPWKVARETTTIDRLSNGRLVLPVGLGAVDDRGVTGLGEQADRRVRAERLDEVLDIVVGLWSGEPFGHAGRHYQFEPMAFVPTPVQRPRIPIWVVGAWPNERSMARALRHDGWLPYWLARKGSAGLARPNTPQSLPRRATGSESAAVWRASRSSWRARRQPTIDVRQRLRSRHGRTPVRLGGSNRIGRIGQSSRHAAGFRQALRGRRRPGLSQRR